MPRNEENSSRRAPDSEGASQALVTTAGIPRISIEGNCDICLVADISNRGAEAIALEFLYGHADGRLRFISLTNRQRNGPVRLLNFPEIINVRFEREFLKVRNILVVGHN